MLCQEHLCHKLPKLVDVHRSYGVQHQRGFFETQCIALLLHVGQPMGSLQAVKESLMRMRCQRERLSAAGSSTAVTASASVRAGPMKSLHQEDNSSVMCIGNELIRYVLDDKDLSSLAVNDKTTSSAGEDIPSSDPCVISIALQHQQCRAQVLTLTDC